MTIHAVITIAAYDAVITLMTTDTVVSTKSMYFIVASEACNNIPTFCSN
jgi:hypothetical protein